MVQILETAVNAVMPICFLIALGWLLRRKRIFSDTFTQEGSRFSFQYLIPTMLFHNVYKINSIQDISWGIVLYSVACVLLLYGLGCLIVPLISPDNRRKGVLLQGVFRSNTAVIGISLAATLGGVEASAVTSVVSAFTVPLLNTLSVFALSRYLRRDTPAVTSGSILYNVVHNPLTRGIFLALLALLIRWGQLRLFGRVVFSIQNNLKFVYTVIGYLSSCATPFALLILGAQFRFSDAGAMGKEILWGTFLRLIAAPAIAIGFAWVLSANVPFFRFGPADYASMVALFATPVAVASSIMAGQMGSDETLAGHLVVWTSLCSILTEFVLVCILMRFGLLVPAV